MGRKLKFLYWVLWGIPLLFSGFIIWLVTQPESFKGFFPENLKSSFILRLDQLKSNAKGRKLIFQLNELGQPTLLVKDTIIILQHQKGEEVIPPLKISGVKALDHFAWMRDGALLMIAGKRLGGLTKDGFTDLFNLPAKDMKIVPASPGLCYLYGGDNHLQQQNLYLFKKGGKLLNLFKAPSPITAVSGDGEITIAAVGKSIFALRISRPPTLIYETSEEVTSLAIAPPWGIFFSTQKRVGYIEKKGKGYIFLEGKEAEIKIYKETLYLFLKEEGILKCSPISRFDELSQKLKTK